MTRPRQIVAFGGGGFSMEAGNPLLDDYVLGLAAAAGRDRPKVCFLPTASGDADHYVVRFYRHFPAGRCEPSHISLFRRDCGTDDIRSHLLDQTGGDESSAIAGYYQGISSVQNRGMFDDTQRYVANVQALRSRFGG